MKKLLLLVLSLCAVPVMAAPVNVNTADAKTISQSLSGVGQKKAEAIVKYRTEKGLFKTVDDLGNVAGIGPKIIEKNKKDILFDDTGAPAAAPPAEPVAAAPAKKTKAK